MCRPIETFFKRFLEKHNGGSLWVQKSQSCDPWLLQKSCNFSSFSNPIARMIFASIATTRSGIFAYIFKRESILSAEANTARIQSFIVDADSSTHTQLAEVKKSSDATQRSVERNTQVQKDSNEALERRIDQTTEKVSSQLNLLERCQNHYFPNLISLVKSINGIVTTGNKRIQDIRDCQRRYFPRLLFAIQVTLVRIDDLATLGTQLLAA